MRDAIQSSTIPSKVNIDATPNSADNLMAASCLVKLERYQVDTPDTATSISRISEPSGKLDMTHRRDFRYSAMSTSDFAIPSTLSVIFSSSKLPSSSNAFLI